MTDKKGHPHAELMMLYAEKSRTDAEEWRCWEVLIEGSEKWRQAEAIPAWNVFSEYRRKPDPMVVYACVYLQGRKVHSFSTKALAEDYASMIAAEDVRIVKFVEVAE